MRLVEVKGRRQSQAAGEGGKKRGSDEIDGGRDDKSPFTVDLAWLLTRRLRRWLSKVLADRGVSNTTEILPKYRQPSLNALLANLYLPCTHSHH
jgi:hypothetical protein